MFGRRMANLQWEFWLSFVVILDNAAKAVRPRPLGFGFPRPSYLLLSTILPDLSQFARKAYLLIRNSVFLFFGLMANSCLFIADSTLANFSDKSEKSDDKWLAAPEVCLRSLHPLLRIRSLLNAGNHIRRIPRWGFLILRPERSLCFCQEGDF